MIDFSTYQEKMPFKTLDNIISRSGNPEPEFFEAPFNLRRHHYITYLNTRENHLNRLLNLTQINGLDSNSREIQGILNITPSAALFEEEQPKAESANCLGTDQVYDFYRNMLSVGSQLEGLSRYNEMFNELYSDAYQVTHQIFNQIGTRGQFYGYLDTTILIYCDFLDIFINELESAININDMLQVVVNRINQFTLENTTFKENSILGARDMRNIVTPIIKYLNLIIIGSEIIDVNWSTLGPSQLIKNTFYQWNKTVYNFSGDYVLKYKAIASQIQEQMFQLITPDKSNLEMVMTKSIKMAMDETGLSSDLAQTKTEIIIPNY